MLASLSPDTNFSVCDEGSRMFTNLLTYSCILLVVITFPVSIFFCVKHVQVITIIIDYKTPKQLREPLWVSKFVNKGIWAGCHLSAGSYASRRNTGARSINMIINHQPHSCHHHYDHDHIFTRDFLHNSVRGRLWENWHENAIVLRSSARGKKWWFKMVFIFYLHPDSHQGQCDCECERSDVLQSSRCHQCSKKYFNVFWKL